MTHIQFTNPYHRQIKSLISSLIKSDTWYTHSISHDSKTYLPDPDSTIPFITLIGFYIIQLLQKKKYSLFSVLEPITTNIQSISRLERATYRMSTHSTIQSLLTLQPEHLGTKTLELYRTKDNSAYFLATLCNNLLVCEEKVGGPYNSWIVKDFIETSYCHIDSAINGIIHSILLRNGISLPRLNNYFSKQIPSEEILSKPLSLLCGSFDKARSVEAICEELLHLQNEDGYWDTLFDTACAIIFLRNNNVPQHRIGRAYEFVRHALDHNNIILSPILSYQRKSNMEWVISSHQLTQLVCACALITYDSVQSKKQINPSSHFLLKQFDEDTLAWEPAIRSNVRKLYSAYLEEPECNQAVTIPSLIINDYNHASKSLTIEDLSYTNTLVWFSYRLLDSIIDEKNRKALIPLAFASLRLCMKKLNSLPESRQSTLELILSRLENALHWEIEHAFCTLKDESTLTIPTLPVYGRLKHLSHKSSAAVIIPLLTLYRLGFKPHSPECIAMREFFNPYLIARQLSDDAEDWMADLRKGYINPVGAHILRYFYQPLPPPNPLEITISSDLPNLSTLFSTLVFRLTIKKIDNHLTKARQKALPYFFSQSFVSTLLQPLETGLQRAQQNKKDVDTFIETVFNH